WPRGHSSSSDGGGSLPFPLMFTPSSSSSPPSPVTSSCSVDSWDMRVPEHDHIGRSIASWVAATLTCYSVTRLSPVRPQSPDSICDRKSSRAPWPNRSPVEPWLDVESNVQSDDGGRRNFGSCMSGRHVEHRRALGFQCAHALRDLWRRFVL